MDSVCIQTPQLERSKPYDNALHERFWRWYKEQRRVNRRSDLEE